MQNMFQTDSVVRSSSCDDKGCSRQDNRVLHNIALVHMRHHRPARDYVAKKTHEGRANSKSFDISNDTSPARPTGRSSLYATVKPEGSRLANMVPDCANYAPATASPQQQIGEALCVPSSRIGESSEASETSPNSTNGPSNESAR